MKIGNRIWTFVLSILLLADSLVFVAGAAQAHDYVLTLTQPADCVSEGANVYVCSICGDSRTEVLPPLGHDFSPLWTVDREPACNQEGVKSRHCSRCSETTDLLLIQKTQHTYQKHVVAPTCTEAGYTHSVCTICGDERDDSYTPALGHLPGLWIVDREPTCTEEGLRHRDCQRCGALVEQALIPAASHTYRETTVAPTCTEAGYTLHVCTICGDSYQSHSVKATGHTFPQSGILLTAPTCTQKGSETVQCVHCGITQTRTIPALGHDYSSQWTIDKAATCTAKGEQSHHCTRCTARKDVTSIDRLAHTAVSDAAVAPTCTAAGKTAGSHCGVCGAVIEKQTTVPATGHTYGSAVITKQATCTQKGSETAQCLTCGAAKTTALPALGHDYSSQWTIDKAATCTAKGEQSHHCTRCSARTDVTELPRTDHTLVRDVVVAPTCTQSGKSAGAHCAVCGKVLENATTLPKLGHDYVITKTLTEATCTTAGRANVRCSRCGATDTQNIPARGHNYRTKWTIDKEPTCTAKGEKSHHCTWCDKRKDVTEIPRTDHTAVKDPAVAATCTKSGKTAGKHCSVCGSVLKAQKTIPATGHTEKVKLTRATLKQAGRRVTVCTVCKKTLEKERIPAIHTVRLSQARFVYDKSAKTPAVTVKDTNKKALKKGTDYTVAYAKGRKKIGTYTVTVQFRGNYSGKKTLRFRIVPKAPTGITVTATTNTISLSWNAVPGATGYFLYRCDGKKPKRIAVAQNTFFSVKNLKPSAAYSFLIRAYTKVGKEILWSADSAQKSAATLPKTPHLKLKKQGRAAVLSWNNCGKHCVYEIYHSDTAAGPFACIGKTKKTSFTTPSYAKGSTACFKVKAIVDVGGSALSSTASGVKKLQV